MGPRGNLSTPSPGLAIVDGDQLLVGLEAKGTARLKPRRLHSHFWQELGTAPLKRPFPGHLRSADLAHAHLADVWQASGRRGDEVIIAVPGLFSQEQLGLLLGIAEACDMVVQGLVDVALASTVDRATRRRCLHLDLHLHRAVLTEIEHGSEAVRGAVEEETRVGLLGLHDTWARVLSKRFIHTTRFDPLHRATSEQVLYIQLPGHLASLAVRESTQVAISSGGRRHTVDLQLRDIVDAAQTAYEILSTWVREKAGADKTSLLVSERIASLPGFVNHLRETTDLEITVLHPSAACSALHHHAGRICPTDGALSLVTRLPGYHAKPPSPVTVAVTPPPGTSSDFDSPTHLVLDGVAHRITEKPFVIGNAIHPTNGGPTTEEHQESGREIEITIRRDGGRVVLKGPREAPILVNDQPVEGAAALRTGDRLRVGDAASEVILVTLVE